MELQLSTNTFYDYLVYQQLLKATEDAEQNLGPEDELVQDMFWNLIECLGYLWKIEKHKLEGTQFAIFE